MKNFILKICVVATLMFSMINVYAQKDVSAGDFESIQKKAAEQQGLAEAQYNLGVMYYNGEGVKQDLSKAKDYYGKGCDNGLQKSCDAYKTLNQQGIK